MASHLWCVNIVFCGLTQLQLIICSNIDKTADEMKTLPFGEYGYDFSSVIMLCSISEGPGRVI